ncbi:S9 family peptidase [Sulfodiicoccus acidiphilus]|uniref:S9 family peptidase n=1 Tax=Sulfodiicoccus acidiphilus TaxID=1670455 RepID=UPI00166459ED|nr:S9 family peptidase [Sulfodiicoccus acidiphilus]
MDYSVLNSRPVLDYDVSRGRVALILWEDEPNAYVQGRKVEVREPEQVRWVGDNLALVADSGGSEKRSIYLYDGSLHELLADGNDNVDPTFVREDRFLFISNRDGRTTHLYLYDGGEVTRLSEGELPVSDPCLSPSGRYVVYSQGVYDNDLFLLDLSSWERRRLSFRGAEDVPASSQCFRGDSILFLSNVSDTSEIGTWDFSSGEVEWLKTARGEKLEAVPYGEGIAYTVNEGGDVSLVVKERKISPGVVVHLKVDEGLYFLRSDSSRDFDLYVYDGEVKRLTDSMAGVTEEFVEPRKVTYTSDGLEIDALLYSRGGEERGVLYLHGGPDWECLNLFSPEVQLLVSRGFKVVCPNYRGSTGRGRKFNHLNDGDLGGGDLRDALRAAELLGERVAVTGASYGGYLTMMAVTKHPERWCAAAAVVPFVNWFTEKELEREVLKQYDEVKMGNDEALLRDRSPIFFVDRIRVPLLLLAGENDPRCPAEETMQVVRKLEELGRRVEYKVYKGEGHGFSKKENYVDSVKRVVEFLDENCRAMNE